MPKPKAIVLSQMQIDAFRQISDESISSEFRNINHETCLMTISGKIYKFDRAKFSWSLLED